MGPVPPPQTGYDEFGAAGGGTRFLVANAMNERHVSEAGISSVTGLGNYPTGASVYRALRQAQGYGATGDLIQMRIIGTEVVPDDYVRGDETYDDDGDPIVARNQPRSSYKSYLLEQIEFMRFGDTGSGAGEEADGQDDAGDYGNLFLRVMSELSGFDWKTIRTVQFY